MKNKVVVITGGNSGIGYATARLFRKLEANVIITGRRKEAVEKAALELNVSGIVADQSSLAAIDRLVAEIQSRYGKIDVLFVNAGVITLGTIAEMSEQQFDHVIDTNFKGAYFTLSRFIPLLNDGSSIVLLSSNTASMTVAGSSVYSASKAALNAVMKTASLELAPRGIRVNAVSPGPTETEIMHKVGLDEATLHEIKEMLMTKIPLNRTGTADDVASMVAYLCGESAGFITGSEVLMDGGMVLA